MLQQLSVSLQCAEDGSGCGRQSAACARDAGHQCQSTSPCHCSAPDLVADVAANLPFAPEVQRTDALALFFHCSAPELVADVAANLPFAPEVQALADRVTRGIAQKGAPAFNSLHLRMEADAKDWMDIIGGSRVGLLCSAMRVSTAMHDRLMASSHTGQRLRGSTAASRFAVAALMHGNFRIRNRTW